LCIIAILHAAALENETDNKLHLPTGGAQGAWQREMQHPQQPSLPLSAAKSFLIMKNVRNICSK